MSSPLLLALLAAAALLLLAYAAQVATTFGLLLRLRFRPGQWRTAQRAAFPDDVRLLLDGAAPELEALGFRYAGSAAIRSAQVLGDPPPILGDYYQHAEQPAFAFVQPAEQPEASAVTAVSFDTLLRDGSWLITLNRRGHLLLPLPPHHRVEDADCADLASHWAHHCRRLEEAQDPVTEEPEAFWRREEEHNRTLLDYLRSTQVLTPAGQDLWRLRAGAAWCHLRQLLAGARRLAKRPRPAAEAPAAARVAADLRAFHANEALLRSGVYSRTAKVLFFAVSAALGALAFGLVFSWQMVPIVLGVLLFHEFGHALAMRLSGYRQLGVLVLPLLGAVAIGRKDDAGPWHKLFVLLAGPLPGLLIAVVCLRLALGDPEQHQLLLQLGAMGLGLNLFNLLPAMPLDGGQIVETFLFSHFPRLRFAFAAASWLALAGLGLWLDSHVLIAVAGVMAVGGPALARRFALAAQVGTVAPGAAPRAAFENLHRDPKLSRLPFRQRLFAVKGALPLIVGRRPRPWESAVCLVVYLAAVALPLAYLLQPEPVRAALATALERHLPAPQEPMRDWDGELAQAATQEQRWQIQFEAGQWYEEMEEEEHAAQRYQAALALAQGFPAGDLRLLDSRLGVLRMGGNGDADLVRGYLDLLPELRALQGETRERLAEALEALEWLDQDAPLAERIARLREAVSVRAALPQETRDALASDRRDLARLLDRQGESRAAENELRANLVPKCSNGPASAINTSALAWFLIAHQRSAEVEALVTQHTADNSNLPIWFAEPLAWARIDQGRFATARAGLAASLETQMGAYSSYWRRLPLLLDLVHASSDDAAVRAQWLEQARRLAASLKPSSRQAFGRRLCFTADDAGWEAPRDQARLAVWEEVLPEQERPPARDICGDMDSSAD